MPLKHGNTLLSEISSISSFYVYDFFRNFRTPLHWEPGTTLFYQTGKLKFHKKHAGNDDFVESKGLHHGSLKFLKDAFTPKKTTSLMVAQSPDQAEAVSGGVL